MKVTETNTRANEFLDQVAETCLAAVFDVMPEISKEAAESIADKVYFSISDQFGGEVLYIAKLNAERNRSRYKKIYDDFKGNNHRELARKYRCSMQTIYKILKSYRPDNNLSFNFDEEEE